ncbi:MAG: amidohydrolase [Gemmataceae bacterium]|nr:amidohydrolase [Gemmataceae bacterium]
MGRTGPSRRDLLRAAGGVLLGGVATAAADPPADGIVDTHVHITDAQVPGGRGGPGPLGPFDPAKDPDGPARTAKRIGDELTAAGVTHALCMPAGDVSDDDPLGVRSTAEQAKLVRGAKLYPVGVLHPERFDRNHLNKVEAELEKGRVKALKAYLGYFHYAPTEPAFRPYYRLAAKYNVPVVLHTGDTWSRTAKLKYAHPLPVDEVAVDFPGTKFVMAHFGNPWLADAAGVLYKNGNVWADLSAVRVGDAKAFAGWERDGSLAREVERVKSGIDFVADPGKFVYGSDWPLAPIATYRDFVKKLFPAKDHPAVFRENARKLFRL